MQKLVYEKIYDKLEKLGILELKEHKKLHSEGFMDLSIDILHEDEEVKVIAMAHNYIQNGDVMADPDMEIKIHKRIKMAEALTFQQDPLLFQRVYHEVDGKTFVNKKVKTQLNTFLNSWLNNIKQQGFKA